MGTPDFSVPTLEALIESEHEVVGVVTQPDKPKGRSRQLQAPPVKVKAIEAGIAVYQPQKIRQEGFIDEMKLLDIDLAVVIAFGQILPKDFLEMPTYGCLNVHASLLPKYRGAGPIQWSVINGETITGVTTMYMDVGIDTGDMLLKEEVVIEDNETGGSLHDKLSLVGGPLILETIKSLEDGSLVRIPQDDDASTYAPMLDKQLGNINWNKPAVEIERLVRGLNPWPSAYTYLNDKMLKLWEAKVVVLEDDDHMPGSIFEINKQGMIVKCNNNGLLVTSLQLQGKKRMAAADFLRGYNVEEGMILGKIRSEE